MATVFTRIIDGELPGRFVWRDPVAVAFLSINPLRTGHALVVPRVEVDHWIDLEPDVARHCMGVAQAVGLGAQAAFSPARVGLIIAGFEVPHAHVHVIPIDGMGDLDFAHAASDPDPGVLDDAAERLRGALRALGHPEASA